jgi:hypothetical protein
MASPITRDLTNNNSKALNNKSSKDILNNKSSPKYKEGLKGSFNNNNLNSGEGLKLKLT